MNRGPRCPEPVPCRCSGSCTVWNPALQTRVQRTRRVRWDLKTPEPQSPRGRPGKVTACSAVAGTAARRPWSLPGLTDHPDLLTCAAEQRGLEGERGQWLRKQGSKSSIHCS